MAREGVKSIARNAMYLMSARAVSSIGRVIYVVVAARMLGAELYGLFNYGLAWYLFFLPLCVLGLEEILLREIGRDRAHAADLITDSLVVRSAGTLLIAAVSLGVGLVLESDPVIRLLFVIFTGALIGRGMSLWSAAIFKGYESSGVVLVLEVSIRVTEIVLGIWALQLGYGVIVLASIHAGCWILQGILGFILVDQRLCRVHVAWHGNRALRLLKLGVPFVVAALFLSWLLQGPILLFRYATGFGGELGQVVLALQAMFIIGSVVSELGGAALPAAEGASVNRTLSSNSLL